MGMGGRARRAGDGSEPKPTHARVAGELPTGASCGYPFPKKRQPGLGSACADLRALILINRAPVSEPATDLEFYRF